MNTKTIAIPDQIDDVDPTWLTAVLHESGRLSPDYEVASFVSSRVGNGLVCESIRYELTYDQDAGGDAPFPVRARSCASSPPPRRPSE